MRFQLAIFPFLQDHFNLEFACLKPCLHCFRSGRMPIAADPKRMAIMQEAIGETSSQSVVVAVDR